MAESMNNVQRRLRDITSKYAPIVKFEVVPEIFEPQCTIRLDAENAEQRFADLDAELGKVGFRIQLTRVKPKDREKDPVMNALRPEDLLYQLLFVPMREVDTSEGKRKREWKISAITMGITGVTVALSAWFYFAWLEPLFGYQNNAPWQNVLNTIWFSLGMMLIILCHELGHKYTSEKNNIPASPPYLIPGPPPIGIFGAFVSIKNKMGTRTKMFDIALGGILGGLAISVVLIVIGYALSVRVATEDYLNLRIAMVQAFNPSSANLSDQAEYLAGQLDRFSLGMLGIQMLFFPPCTTFMNYGGFSLPTQLIILHPLAYAGWVGLVTSGLNLVPLPMLDGGHILRSIFPQRYAAIIGLVLGAILYGFISPYLLYFVLFSLNGALNELTRDTLDPKDISFPFVPLHKSRKYVGLLLVGILVLTYPLSGNALISPVSF